MHFVFTSAKITHHHLRLMTSLGIGVRKASGDVDNILITGAVDDRANDADVLLTINLARPDHLPARVRHIVWVQDLMNWPTNGLVADRQQYEAKAGPNDIIYTLGDGRSVGVDETDPHWRGSLSEAVSESLFDKPYREPELDLSFVGYIPPPVETYANRSDIWIALLQDKIKELYHPLRGELDPLGMCEQLREFSLSMMEDKFNCLVGFENSVQGIKWMVIEYCRQLDRTALGRLMLSVSEDCELRGGNWELYPEFKKYHKLHTDKPEVIHDTYQRSRINLQVNITGFGIHSRVLECMALGCFVMSHTTVRDCVGQLTECFDPDVHYGAFTPENFKGLAEYWLENPEARKKVATEARKVVRAGHLWEHRGAQILKDLRDG